jgi:hypothetical protein
LDARVRRCLDRRVVHGDGGWFLWESSPFPIDAKASPSLYAMDLWGMSRWQRQISLRRRRFCSGNDGRGGGRGLHGRRGGGGGNDEEYIIILVNFTRRIKQRWAKLRKESCVNYFASVLLGLVRKMANDFFQTNSFRWPWLRLIN